MEAVFNMEREHKRTKVELDLTTKHQAVKSFSSLVSLNNI